jgi:hypothetical protein
MEAAQRYSAEGKQRHRIEFYDKALQERDRATTGRRYLERVGLTVRERQYGQMPTWFEAVSASKNRQDCDMAATAGGWRPKQ